MKAKPVVGVVGATGAVGRVVLSILAERKFPHSKILAYGSSRSAGSTVPFDGRQIKVADSDDADFSKVDLVLLDTPDEVAARIAPLAVKGGAAVVDNSASFRMDKEVPLVIPEVNAPAIQTHKGIIASPNCTTVGFVTPLGPLHERFGLERLTVASYQAVSGAGREGVVELEVQATKLIGDLDALGAGRGLELSPTPKVFAGPIAFNVIPQIGGVRDSGLTSEEEKLVAETRKILDLDSLPVFPICVRVPVVTGHGIFVHAEFSKTLTQQEALATLGSAAGVTVTSLPNPLAAAGDDTCHVGRIRVDPTNPRSLTFFSVSDNLRKGAALNTVQVAELLLKSSD